MGMRRSVMVRLREEREGRLGPGIRVGGVVGMEVIKGRRERRGRRSILGI